ncbi:hypothetical protein QM806_04655 [Rhodococcus sp. IEGM 1351]|uniref:hypothetical protein n=1 Tax=Rhodococcus sp. IEGM 1351 TaxID=3047089 RepID=UPI0024B6750C|nr:hypothetical protein [Rhodococcus sp. IEGM 1351]MDI9934746.1 hypothetical protein [Rhodococcus sp. IEGM 1351]
MSLRSVKELQEEEKKYSDIVWYERKLVMLANIQEGIEEMPPEDIMDGMTAGMRRIEAQYGKENLPAKDDFDWGMTNGKLSAIRWMLGDDWDSLDT